MGESVFDRWLGDDPQMSFSADDLYDRERFVARAADVLKRIAAASPSSVSALIGPWGSGKSSVLDNVVTLLRARQWHVVRLNPWLYGSAAALHAGFFAELRSALPKQDQWSTTRETLLTWGRRLTPVAAFGQLAGYDAREAVSQTLDLFEGSASDQLALVESAMRDLKDPVLMVVDDLDRLGSDELLHLFKLVRLVGRLPNVHYLLSYDERTLIDLLGKTDLVAAGDERRALDYLEKIVQVRFDVPLLRQHQVDSVVSRSLDDLIRNHNLDMPVDEKKRIIRIYDTQLSARLRTPRTLHRFFAQLDVFLESVAEEVRLDDFIQLTWLRVVEPGVYAALSRFKDDLLGLPRDSERAYVQDEKTLVPDVARWLQRLQSAHVAEENRDDILYLLRVMFPNMHGFGEESFTPPARPVSDTPASRMKAISHPDYFDRYFAYAVPREDIPDNEIRDFFLALKHSPDPSSASLPAMGSGPVSDLMLRKIEYLMALPELVSMEAFLWLAHLYEGAAAFGATASRIERVATALLGNLEPEDIRRASQELPTTDKRTYLLGVIHQSMSGMGGVWNPDDERAAALLDELTPRLRAAHETLLEEHDSPLSASWHLTLAFSYWYEADPDSYTEAFNSAVSSGRWSGLDVTALMVLPSMSGDGEMRITKYSSLGASIGMLNLGSLAAVHAADIRQLDPLPDELGVVATAENRRRYALQILASVART